MACGFCCDGRLFSLAPLTADEAAWARRRRLPLVAHAESVSLAQPCGALDRRRCTVYEERPASCRRFVCVLLDKVMNGELPLPAALAHVECARTAPSEDVMSAFARAERPESR
jgi:Fe-S-cluster containining protein